MTKKEMIEFLAGHFRYCTTNSWNGASSYAVNVKIHRREELRGLDNAHEMLDQEEAQYEVRGLVAEFDARWGYRYQLGFNGRSGGYMVLYRGGCEVKKIVEFRTGEERAYSDRLGRWVSREEAARDGLLDATYKAVYTMPGQSIGSRDPEFYAEMSAEELRAEVKLVKDLDRTAAACCRAFADFCRANTIKEEEVSVPKVIRRAVPNK